jgi:hypothetical protein
MKFGKEGKEWVFQHNSEPKHTRKSTVKWFNNHNIAMEYTIPDMNPIKHL